jgi:hypothetical protein
MQPETCYSAQSRIHNFSSTVQHKHTVNTPVAEAPAVLVTATAATAGVGRDVGAVRTGKLKAEFATFVGAGFTGPAPDARRLGKCPRRATGRMMASAAPVMTVVLLFFL